MAVLAVRPCGNVSSSQLSKARVAKPRRLPRRLGCLREDSRERTSEHSRRQPRGRPSPLSPACPSQERGAAADVCNPQATWRGGAGTYDVLAHLGERCKAFTKSAEERSLFTSVCT